MAKARSQHPDRADPGAGASGSSHAAENVGLLSAEAEAEAEAEDYEQNGIPYAQQDGAASPAPAPASAAANGRPRPKPAVRVASSPSILTPTDRTPRTPQRVRFDPNPTILHGLTPNGTVTSFETTRTSEEAERDSVDDNDGRNHQSRRPLLTGIEAPSVALANSPWAGEFEDVHSWAESERSRPKSGLPSAFMNMANSIIGAGIIGQPYAFKQAGLLSGIILLVGLTIVVDWTICLIVVNSKLSGANSFQGTVEKCFGKSGLIAISLAQWLFAFGGMVAFGVVVGDTIPHVLSAVWPGLRDVPVLGLVADRKGAIVVFILSVSYPLTLYRDIAKVRCRPLLLTHGHGAEADLKYSLRKPARSP